MAILLFLSYLCEKYLYVSIMSQLFPTDLPYKVADMSLAEFGRKEIEISEHEMPGLMVSVKNMVIRSH